MKKPIFRYVLCASFLGFGLVAQAGLERLNATERPPLREPLSTLPLELEGWIGVDKPADPEIIERSQATQYLNRVYESRANPGVKFSLWINYSEFGNNLRHTPEICLPSSGWEKVESLTKEVRVPVDGESLTLSRLGYGQGDLVKHVGFWYYIFGEGRLENMVRQLPITSRSSHGRTTRGSSITIEVFYSGDIDPEATALGEFAQELTVALEPILPTHRAGYHIP